MISFEKSVGAVVFRRRGSQIMYLVLHYPSGHWDFPKGHVEKGETENETLEREVQEETGINDLQIISGFKTQIRYFYRAGKEEKEKRKKNGKFFNVAKKVTYHLAETKTKNVSISLEHINYDWLCFGDALARITYKNGKDVLSKADKFLKSKI